MESCRDKKIKRKGRYRMPKDKTINKSMKKYILERAGQRLQGET
jgi:hypothetical protein